MTRGLKKGERRKVSDRNLPVISDTAKMPKLLSVAECARFLGIAQSTLNKGRCTGILKNAGDLPPFVKISGRIYYKTSDVEKWLESLEARQAI